MAQRHSSAPAQATAPITDVGIALAPVPEIPYPSENGLERDACVLSFPQRIAKHLPYCGVILLLPLFVLSVQINPIYPPPGGIDSWVYLGFFRNFVNFEGALFRGTYYGSRLSWILPGVLIHHIFPPMTAACVLHLLVYFVALFSFYYTVSATIGRRAAMLSSIIFGLYPYFWGAIGWDYVDGAGIAYYLLTTALLTKAASTRSPRRILAAAGAGFAALLYSNLAWALFTPVLVVHYLGLKRPAGIREWRSVIVQAAMLGVTGGLGLTLILSLINYSVGGGFWFYAPSVMFVLHFGQKNPWYQEAYAGGLPVPWLWFPILTLLIGLAVCARLLAGWRMRHGRTNALFTVELLIASTILVYLQIRGQPLLGLPFYASYLIPVVFLAVAPLFWPSTEELGPRWFAIAVAAAILLVAAGWWAPGTSRLIQWSRPGKYVFVLAAAGALVSAMLLQKRRYAIALSVAGFGLLNMAVSSGRPADTDSWKRAYQRVMNARAVVEQVRGPQRIRWWYNEKESSAYDFTAVSSTYLWGFTLIGLRFPDLPQKPVFTAPCILAVISSRPDTAEAARLALAQPLKEQGLTATLQRVSVIQDQSIRYTLALLEIEKDLTALKPVAAASEPDGARTRPTGTAGRRPHPLPAERWHLRDYLGAMGQRDSALDGPRVLRPRLPHAYSTVYPLLMAPEDTPYRSVLRYKPVHCNSIFEALPVGQSAWLTRGDLIGLGNGYVVDFELPSKQGQGFWPLTSKQ